MTTLSQVLVTAHSPATLIFGAQGSNAGLIQVVNLDDNNTVYIGTSQSMTPAQSSTVFPLGPSSSMSFDGSVATYGITQSGQTAYVGIVPEGGSYSSGTVAISGPVTADISGPVTVSSITTPVNIGTVSGSIDIASVSGNVDVVGQGGYIVPGQLISMYNQAFSYGPGGGATTASLSTQNFSSIDIAVEQVTGNSTATNAAITLQGQIGFTDSNGFICKIINFNCLIPGGGQSASTTVNVPCYGNSMTISLNNNGAVGTVTGTLSISGSYRTLNTPTYSFGFGTILTGWTAGGITWTPYNLSFQASGTISNGTSITGPASGVTVGYIITPYFGPCYGQFTQSTAALASDATIVDLGVGQTYGNIVAGGGQPGQIINFPNFSSASVITDLDQIALPMSPCAFIFKGGTSAANLAWQMQGTNI